MRATRWVLLMVVGLCCLTAPTSYASDARVEAMAVDAQYLEDYVNLDVFPTVAARYANLVMVSLGEASSSSDRSVGVIGAGNNTNYGVFAIFLNQTMLQGWEQAQLDITWAKQFSGATVGAGILYTKSSVEQGSAKETPINGGDNSDFDNPGANQLAITGGVKIDMNNTSMLELGAQLGWWSWEEKDAAGTITSEDAGNLSYMLAGRIMSEVSNQTTLVPSVSFSRIDLTEEPGPAATEEDFNRNMVNLGVALHHEVNGNDLLVLGVSADYVKDKMGTGVEFSTWQLPSLFAALEFDVYSWLTVRAGARKTFDRTNDKTFDPEVDTLASDFRFGLGMGLHFDHFDVDATVEPDAVHSGGYLLTGDSTSNTLARVTATYFF